MFNNNFIQTIVTGERIQNCADVYIGNAEDFEFNPFITLQKNKQKLFSDLTKSNTSYDNPRIVFCYGHNIHIFKNIIHLFLNPFILITHNSDNNIRYCETVNFILNCSLLQKWYAQNIEYIHEKLHFLPIGLANSMWEHGNLSIYNTVLNLTNFTKSNNVYFNFSISTNVEKRVACKQTIEKKINFLETVSHVDNIIRLSQHRFCICPEGNGLDTHRFWESLYLKTVPIVLRNVHSEIIKNTTGLPMVILDSWDDFNLDKLPDYNSFDFEKCSQYLNIEFYKELF